MEFDLNQLTIHQHTAKHMAPLPSIHQYHHIFWSLNLDSSNIESFALGSHMIQGTFTSTWEQAHPTAHDTLCFKWAKGESDLKLPIGAIEQIAASPPFYIGIFLLKTLKFLAYHFLAYKGQNQH